MYKFILKNFLILKLKGQIAVPLEKKKNTAVIYKSCIEKLT